MRRTKEDAEQTRRAILASAMDMFYEKGYRPYDSPTRWVPERCINCEMLMRGSSVYPDGW